MTYDFIFVVLVYRNTFDLIDFFASLKLERTRVIVVNSFYDEESELKFKQIAESNHADFLSVPNNGYGTGNNRGVKYALDHYDFKYLVISNADVEIKAMSKEYLDNRKNGIYAPSIKTLSGKQQNPHMPYHIKMIDKLKYKLFCKNYWTGILLFCAVNKILRNLFFITTKLGFHKIYTAHGAFVIFPKEIVEDLYPFYDEDVFLFTEEENLGQLAQRNKINTYFVPKVKIRHKEDGSTSMISDKQRDITRKSYITFYKKWYV